MDSECAFAPNLMQAAAAQMRVRDQSLNPGQPLEEIQEQPAIQLVDERPRRRSEVLNVFGGPLALEFLVARMPLPAIHRLELDEDLLQQVRIEETVEHDVRERIRGLVRLGVLRDDLFHAPVWQRVGESLARPVAFLARLEHLVAKRGIPIAQLAYCGIGTENGDTSDPGRHQGRRLCHRPSGQHNYFCAVVMCRADGELGWLANHSSLPWQVSEGWRGRRDSNPRPPA